MKTTKLLTVAIRFVIAITFIAFSGFAYAQETIEGDGNVVSKTHDLEPFDEVSFSGAFEVYLQQGDTESIEIITDENLHEYIEFKVFGDELMVEWKDDINITDSKELKIVLTYKVITEIEVAGAIELTGKDPIKTENFIVEISGAAALHFDLDVQKFRGDFSGASDVNLKGSARKADMTISGVGNIDAEDFRVETLDVEMSGAGNAEVWVTESLDVDISGIGNVSYKGNPKEIRKSIALFGNLQKIDD